ncbi:MAG TPA: glycoside hydrolase family 95 protein, partial [Povalibacter sp.]
MRTITTMAQVVLAALFVCTASQAGESPLTLWYGAPAADWEREALPIGNGALGAMIFGGIDTERLQFNEKTLWTGGPGSQKGYDFGIAEKSLAPAVADVVATLDRQQQLEPADVAARLGRKIVGYGDYQTFGDLMLEFPAAPGAVSNYRRELDLQQAVARVSYERGGIRYLREYFASYPDGVIVMRLSADRPAQISLRMRFAVPDNRTVRAIAEGKRLEIDGVLKDNGLQYAAMAHVRNEAGSVTSDKDGSLRVSNANAVNVVLGAATNYRQHYPDYRGGAPRPGLTARVEAAAGRSFADLQRRHQADYKALFDRVQLDIGQAPVRQSTDQLLARYGSGDAAADRALEALYFQYGRYLLVASSRAGSLPANLQG